MTLRLDSIDSAYLAAEYAAFDRLTPAQLVALDGRWVLVIGSDVVGSFETASEADGAGSALAEDYLVVNVVSDEEPVTIIVA